ncbi:MAG TPA: bifunctional protein-serine/threonine kinase/phosphatase [Limnobacter sp.]|nr:bifunctional protein-serine/threonine kinase/phosphatase [Limnobacter sp.]
MSTSLRVAFGACSVAGVKSANQDAFAALCGQGDAGLLKGAAAVIADGLSTCANAHLASQTVVTSFVEDYFGTPNTWSATKSAKQVVSSLNAWLHHHNTTAQHLQDQLLTTMAAVVIKSNTAHCMHVGDSRIYHVREGRLDQLTEDHSRTQRGQVYLARALGADRHVDLSISTQEVQVGDLLLLTTDGVHAWLKPGVMQALITHHSHHDLEHLARQLVNEALAQGSEDNLTALLIRIDSLPQETLEETHQRLTRLPIPPVMQAGNKIDGYEVLEVIFCGTRSHMYRVRDLSDGTQYTLKAPSEQFAEDAMHLDGFAREEWVGQCIDHPNVMKTFLPKQSKRFLYYLGEYIEGINLRQWMYDNPKPPLDEVRKIARQVIAGLRAFQRADMVHQDIKPENIMIDVHGRIKILDFGTVLVAGAEELVSPLDKSVPQGSVNYVAPEYLMGESGSFQADLFSLAVVLYEMLTGHLPFAEKSVKQVTLKSYKSLKYIPARQRRIDLPLWVEACLQKALQPNPLHRYAALSEFLQDFSVPNVALESELQRQPLAQKDPMLLWKILVLVLLGLNLFQMYLHLL